MSESLTRITQGESLPIFVKGSKKDRSGYHNDSHRYRPDSREKYPLKELMKAVSVELVSSTGGVLGNYQIEMLVKVESVRQQLLRSAKMTGSTTAAYQVSRLDVAE